MRLIKYRGWSPKYGQNYYGQVVVKKVGTLIYDGGYVKVLPESVDALIEIDVNGASVYERDLVTRVGSKQAWSATLSDYDGIKRGEVTLLSPYVFQPFESRKDGVIQKSRLTGI